MAASLIASENPVVIPKAQQSKTITITWATGDGARGKVFEVSGNFEILFDDGGIAAGNTRGSKQRTVSLGDTIDFRLRRSASPNPVLASLTVTTQPAISVLDTVGAGHVTETLVGRFQLISDLKVVPSLDYVDFSFRTTQPTVPLITLTTGAPDSPPGTAVTFAYPLYKGHWAAGRAHTVHGPIMQSRKPANRPRSGASSIPGRTANSKQGVGRSHSLCRPETSVWPLRCMGT